MARFSDLFFQKNFRSRLMSLTPAMASRIEMWPMERLIPYARNARTHSDAQVAQIAASMLEFGVNNPLLVDSRGGLVAGHGRLLAARKLSLEQLPVVVLDHLTENQRRAYILADNRLAELAGWDAEMLALELSELEGEFDFSVMGFDEEEVHKLLGSSATDTAADTSPDDDGAEDEEDAPVPDAPAHLVSRAGDVWLWGRHRLPAWWSSAGQILCWWMEATASSPGMAVCLPPASWVWPMFRSLSLPIFPKTRSGPIFWRTTRSP
jgi:hypothetical protein